MEQTSLMVTVGADTSQERKEEAQAFADRVHLPWVASVEEVGALAFVFANDRLELHARAAADESSSKGWLRPFAVDFRHLDVRSSQGRRRDQPLAKAVGLKKASGPLRVMDATAGFGEDSWLLAGLGCEVLAVERSPVIAALLEDGLKRAKHVAPEIAERITMFEGDATQLLEIEAPSGLCLQDWDVVYLDPMFPCRSKSALERKEMRILRRIVGEDADADQLFAVARELAKKRVVVKRPTHAAPLFPDPTTSHFAKALRYDVYAGFKKT